jgi:hypothetical protein
MQQFETIPNGSAIFDPAGLVSAKFYPERTIAGLVIPSHIEVKHENGERYQLDPSNWGRVQVAMLTPKLNA